MDAGGCGGDACPQVGDGRAEKPWLGQCPAARGCGGWPAQREGAVSKAIDLLVRGCLARWGSCSCRSWSWMLLLFLLLFS